MIQQEPKPEQKNSLKKVLDNSSLDSKAKIMEITSRSDLLDEIKEHLEKTPNKIGLIHNNKVNLTFVSSKRNLQDFHNISDDLSDNEIIIEAEAVKELLSDFLEVVDIRSQGNNQFQVELANRTQAQLVKYAFDGLDLENLSLKLVVSGLNTDNQNSDLLKTGKTGGIKSNKKQFPIRKYSMFNQNTSKRNKLQKNGQFVSPAHQRQNFNIRNSLIPNVMMNNVDPEYQMKFIKNGMSNFQNQSYNGNMMPRANYQDDNYQYLAAQYQMATFNMMNPGGKGGKGKGKNSNQKKDLNINRSAELPLPPGIVLVSHSKNKINTNKFTCRYNVMIENDKNFQVAKKIIGSKGCNMKTIIDSALQKFPNLFGPKSNKKDALKLRLRGKGSGFKEGPEQRESDEPLHLCISAKYEPIYMTSCKLVEDLLNKIYQDYLGYLDKNGSREDKKKLQSQKNFRFQKYEGNAHLFK